MFDMILDGLLTCLTPINILTTFIAVSLGIIVGIWNTRTIQKTKIIDMLSADRENEP